MSTTWAASPGRTTADWYREFATGDLKRVSPTYERLCLGVAADGELCDRLDTLPEPKRQPNLLLASVRFLGGPVASWPEFRAFVLDRWADVSQVMRARRTQTNEARRCTALLPVLARLPQPVALLEVGASAGLCLFPDRWSYRYEGEHDDYVLGDGPELRCRTTGPVPLPERIPTVAWRAGIDTDPLDVGDEEDVRWLEALIWPEQTERFDILADAVRTARADPPTIHRADLTRDLPELARQAPPEATLVVFHTAVLAYVDDAGRRAFRAALADLPRTVCWLANEAPGVLPETEELSRPDDGFVLTQDAVPIAWAAGHGQRLDWLADRG